jgi:hypothetical protein
MAPCLVASAGSPGVICLAACRPTDTRWTPFSAFGQSPIQAKKLAALFLKPSTLLAARGEVEKARPGADVAADDAAFGADDYDDGFGGGTVLGVRNAVEQDC